MQPYRTTRRVEFVDTDKAGIMHFSNFFRFMESAEQEYLRSLGLGVSLTWEGQKMGFPRVSASCDYLRPAQFEDVLEITVQLKTVGRKSLTFTFDFSHDGDTIARGQISTVCCKVTGESQLESIEIPESIRERLEKS